MKKITLLLFYIALIGVINAQNLIPNGGFEKWTNNAPDNWIGLITNIDSSNIVKSDTAKEGKFSVQLINTSSTQKRFTCDSLQVFAGESYQITFEIKGIGEIRTCLYDTTYGKYNEYVTATNEWVKHIQIVTANKTSTTAEFIFSIKLTDDNGIFLDNVVIEKYLGAEILSFSIAEEIDPAIIISELAQVNSILYWSANLKNIEPKITVSDGAEIIATSLPVVFDGITPVEYKVTAADGTKKFWEIMVKKIDPPVEASIYNIQFTENELGDSPLKDQWVKTSGVVTALNTKGFFLQDSVGPWNGIWVYTPDSVSRILVGDAVTLIGMVEEPNNSTEINDLYEIAVDSSDNELPAPIIISVSELDESFEGVLSTIESVSCVAEVNAANEWEIADTSTNKLVVASDLFLYSPTLGEQYSSITGCFSQSTDTIKLLPRTINDIVIFIGVSQNELSSVSLYPNPVKEQLHINNLQNVNHVIVSNILGQTLLFKALTDNVLTINTSELKTGIYLVTLVSKSGFTRSERIIKE